MSQVNVPLQPAASTPTAPPATVRPYRRFILPSLHRRFTNAALLSLTSCAVQALWMGHYHSFWHLIVFTTLRTLLLFISILAIYVLRVGNLHVGRRTTTSQFHSFLLYVLSLEALKTLLWYSFSALFFCEVYIWSSSESERLSIVDPGRSWERPRLNERPIFLRSMFLCLASAQALVHLYSDYDSVSIPVPKPDKTFESLQSQSQQAFWIPLLGIRKELTPIASRSFFRSLVAAFIAPVIYWLFIRHTAWSWAFWAARLVFELPKSSRSPSFPPLVVDLLGRFFLESLLLMFGWELAHATFNSYLVREPLKQGRLLTDESQDPNGSLVNGLKTSRLIPRSFAFWELLLISQHIETRRQTVFSEINRQGGSTWTQILTVCLGELHAVVKRIQTFQSPSPPPSSQVPEQPVLHHLPRISEPVKQGNIFKSNPPPPRGQALISSSTDHFLTSSGTKLLTYTADATLSKEQQANMSKSGLVDSLQSACRSVLRFPVGIPFRRTFARRASSIALATPHSNATVIVSSVTSLSRLIVHSKKEDKLGTVYRDIANVIRTFTSTHNTIEMFIKRLSIDWTDVNFSEPRRVPELETILSTLSEGLRDIVNEFGEWAEDMGLSAAEMRQAKEVASKSSVAK